MSNLRATINNSGRNNNSDLDFTEFASEQGLMLQITQGLGTQIDNDTPGFIQLTQQDAYYLIQLVAEWLKEINYNKAEKLREQIEKYKELEKTIFQDAVECEHFISDLKVLDIPLRLLR